MELGVGELHLAGMVSEQGFAGQAHWLMFLFEVKPRLSELPPAHREGRFSFFSKEELGGLSLPETDRDQIWPLFWRHRGGFFAAHCRCEGLGGYRWEVEEVLGVGK